MLPPLYYKPAMSNPQSTGCMRPGPARPAALLLEQLLAHASQKVGHPCYKHSDNDKYALFSKYENDILKKNHSQIKFILECFNNKMIKTSKRQTIKMISESDFSLLSVQVQHALDRQALRFSSPRKLGRWKGLSCLSK